MTRPAIEPMLALPLRHSLAQQAASILRDQIAAGAWGDTLPGERRLCSLLQVSRNTIRSALSQLKRAQLVAAVPGVGNRIVRDEVPAGARTLPRKTSRPGRTLRSRDVAFLSPLPLEQLQPRQTLWLDQLRALLGERDCRLRVFHGSQYFRNAPDAALRRLVENEAHGCWILNGASPGVQRWFQAHRVPSVVAGSAHAGIDLPFSDLDHRATCRHAVGALLRLGHARCAFFTFKSSRAGELESIQGFQEGVRQGAQPGAEPLVIYHDGTTASICHHLDWLFRQQNPPTALLVANAYYYLAAATRLAQKGLRIPKDISVMSRDDGAFLNFVVPAPTRYAVDSGTMAKNLLRPVLDTLKGGFGAAQGRFMMPELVRGESIGPQRGNLERLELG